MYTIHINHTLQPKVAIADSHCGERKQNQAGAAPDGHVKKNCFSRRLNGIAVFFGRSREFRHVGNDAVDHPHGSSETLFEIALLHSISANEGDMVSKEDVIGTGIHYIQMDHEKAAVKQQLSVKAHTPCHIFPLSQHHPIVTPL